MKNLKKVLALVVALTMVFTTVAFASYPDVDVEADYAGAVELLSALEILQGDENGNFNPDNTITRAEFAAVVCRALGLEGSAASAKGATMFTDVAADHWASGYINLASQQGIVNGKGNGIFDPEGNVTYAEAVKMLVVAIGYEPMAAVKGGYPAGYLSVANSKKMTAGVAGSADVAALRSTVAMLTANALEIPMMDQTAYGSDTKYEPLDDYDNYTSLLTQMDIYKATGLVGTIDKIEGTVEVKVNKANASEDYAFGWADEDTTVTKTYTFDIGASNVADYANENVDVYVKKYARNKYEAIIAVPAGIGETLTVSGALIEADSDAVVVDDEDENIDSFVVKYLETVDADKAQKINCADVTVLVNGNDVSAKYAGQKLDKMLKDLDAEVTFIENTDDKYFDIIDITIYEHAIVETVVADRNRVEFLGNGKVAYDAEDEDIIVEIYNAEGAAIELADIKEGDVLAMVVADLQSDGKTPKKANNFDTEITIYDLGANSVSGMLNQQGEKEIYIDGVAYEYVENFVSEEKKSDLFDEKGDADLGLVGTFYLGMTGKIIGFVTDEAVAGKYAFVLQGVNNVTSSWDKCIQLKLLLADGTIQTYNVADDAEVNGVPTDYGTDGKAQVDALKAVIGDETEYDNATDYATAYQRVISFATNSKDELIEIDFVSAHKDANVNSVNGEFVANTTKVDGNRLNANAVVFNVDVLDVDDATVMGADLLIDESEYKGTVMLKKDNEYKVFVMTSGNEVFDPEAPLYVVDSAVSSTYGEDNEKCIEVTYFADGSDDAKVAIFTTDAHELYDVVTGADYNTLKKGAVFTAVTAEDGLVSKYAVVVPYDAKNNKFDYAKTGDVLKALYPSDLEKGNNKGVEYIYGTIQDIDGSNIYFGETADEAEGKYNVINVSDAIAYYYNDLNAARPKLEVGEWYGENVDIFDADKSEGNYVFARLFDGDVIEVITFAKKGAAVKTVIADLYNVEAE